MVQRVLSLSCIVLLNLTECERMLLEFLEVAGLSSELLPLRRVLLYTFVDARRIERNKLVQQRDQARNTHFDSLNLH
jgi:hypothetical protein